jgi:hypothetical protein
VCDCRWRYVCMYECWWGGMYVFICVCCANGGGGCMVPRMNECRLMQTQPQTPTTQVLLSLLGPYKRLNLSFAAKVRNSAVSSVFAVAAGRGKRKWVCVCVVGGEREGGGLVVDVYVWCAASTPFLHSRPVIHPPSIHRPTNHLGVVYEGVE